MIYTNESQTRKKLIDQAFPASRWTPIISYQNSIQVKSAALEEYSSVFGPSDYVHLSNCKPIATIKTKKLSVRPQNVLCQAQRYAQIIQNTPLSYNCYQILFNYSTNRVVIWFKDLLFTCSRLRKIVAFHTHVTLEELLTFDSSTVESVLREMPMDHPLLQPYPKNAIIAVEHAGESDPLVSAEEWVDRAESHFTANKILTMDQEKCLDLFTANLIENLAIDRKIFTLLTFTCPGVKWTHVNRDICE